jgi:phosphoglycolate phosphatase
MTAGALRKILAGTRVVLFDFDGPICSVFAGLPAPQVARDLQRVVASLTGQRTVETDTTEDPLEVLRQSARYGPSVVAKVDEALTAAETDAAQVAEPTPSGARCLRAVRRSGHRAAVVTNNSERAARAYLDEHGLTELVDTVIGRHPGRPDLMKPNGWPLLQALAAFPVGAHDAVLVGDTEADIQAARAVGTCAIGYANKPGKRERLAAADVVIEDMAELAEVLEDPGEPA